MALFSKPVKKYLRYALSGLLITSMVAFTGFLSFTGMLVLNDSIYLAMAALFLAGGIEGEVYAYNIIHSMMILFSATYLVSTLVINKLAQLASNAALRANSPFLTSYFNLLKRIKILEASHSDEHQQELEDAKQLLKEMRQWFTKFMLDGRNPDTFSLWGWIKSKLKKTQAPAADAEENPFQADFAKLVNPDDKKKFLAELARKRNLGILSGALSLGAGLSCGLVGYEVAQASILAVATHFSIAISGVALSASVFGLAIVGAIGYSLMIYNTLSDMFNNDRLQKYAKEAREIFKPRPEEKLWRYRLRATASALFIGTVLALGVFMTVSTAGTWWFAAKYAAAVPLMSVTSLAFNIKNSLKSAKEMTEISLRKSWELIKEEVNLYKKTENTVQFYNPARLLITAISLPFKIIIFLLHLVSMSVMGDRTPGVDPMVSTVLNTNGELLVDLHVIFPHSHDADEESNAEHENHACNGHGHGHGNKHAHQHAHNHENDHLEEEDDHVHTDLAGKFLKLVLSPLYLTAACWDYYHSQKNRAEDKPPLSFKAALKKSFFGLHKTPKIPEMQLSAEVLEYQRKSQVQRALKKYEQQVKKPSAASKSITDQAALTDLRKMILEKPADLGEQKKKPDSTALALGQLVDLEAAPEKEPANHSIPAPIQATGARAALKYREINDQCFFSKYNQLSPSAKETCQKIIDRANANARLSQFTRSGG